MRDSLKPRGGFAGCRMHCTWKGRQKLHFPFEKPALQDSWKQSRNRPGYGGRFPGFPEMENFFPTGSRAEIPCCEKSQQGDTGGNIRSFFLFSGSYGHRNWKSLEYIQEWTTGIVCIQIKSFCYKYAIINKLKCFTGLIKYRIDRINTKYHYQLLKSTWIWDGKTALTIFLFFRK